jgi:hypothetical protein
MRNCAAALIAIVTLACAVSCRPASPTPVESADVSAARSPVSTTASPGEMGATTPSPGPGAATDLPTLRLVMERSDQVFGRTETAQIGLGDLDGDGDLDAVFANMGAHDSEIWMNDGSGHFTVSGQLLTRQGHGIGLGDLDGDGDLDIFLTCAHFNSGGAWSKLPSRIYLNNGGGVFEDTGQDIGDTELSGTRVQLIDVDGDGDLDAYVEYYDLGGEPDRVYLNDGQARFTDSGMALLAEEIAWGDVDGDGDLDIFGKTLGEGVGVLLNDGTGHFSGGWRMADSQTTYGETALADFDGDGDLDALVTNGFRTDGSFPSRLLWNDGRGQFTDSGQSLNVTNGASVAAGDFDGNGSLDVYVANAFAPDEIWLNDGVGNLIDSGLRLEADAGSLSTRPALADLDRDGDLDVMLGSFQGRAVIWINMGLPSSLLATGVARG